MTHIVAQDAADLHRRQVELVSAAVLLSPVKADRQFEAPRRSIERRAEPVPGGHLMVGVANVRLAGHLAWEAEWGRTS